MSTDHFLRFSPASPRNTESIRWRIAGNSPRDLLHWYILARQTPLRTGASGSAGVWRVGFVGEPLSSMISPSPSEIDDGPMPWFVAL